MEFNNNDHTDIKELLKENQRLLIENNEILRRMRRNSIISSVLRFLWFVIVVSVPIYVYFNYIQPNWENLKEKIDNLEQVTSEFGGATDGAKEWFDSFNLNGNKDQ